MIDGPGQLVGWAVVMGLLLAWLLLALAYVVVPWVVAGTSMEPTLEQGDRVLVDLWSYRQRLPRPGEVALLANPAGLPIVKRVADEAAGAYRNGDSRLWVLGDNPRVSGDSREFGRVPAGRFRGRVCWRYWPPSRFGPVR
jgi:nickel-type superoxide dismutase maturation protease